MTVKSPPRTCRGCAHRLPYGTCNEPVTAGLADTWGIVWAPAGHAETCPARQTRATTQEVADVK